MESIDKSKKALTAILAALQKDGCAKIYPQGTSMLPLLVQQRDSVVIQSIGDRKIRRGAILLYRRTNGLLVLHRVCRVTKDGIFFAGDNQTVLEGPIARSQVIGIVTELTRKQRTFSVRHPLYQLYWRLWLLLRPIRPYLAAFVKSFLRLMPKRLTRAQLEAAYQSLDALKTPDVCVIVTTKNTPYMVLKRCIDSLRAQTLLNMEIILADCNEEGSPYKEALQNDPAFLSGITVLEIPDTADAVNAKNQAFAACRAKLVTFLSAQDTMPSKRLETVVRYFQTNAGKQCDAVYTNITVQEKNILGAAQSLLSAKSFQALPQLVLRSSAMETVGGFDPCLTSHVDEEFWLRVQSQLTVAHLSGRASTVFVPPDLAQSDTGEKSAIGYRQIAVKHADYFRRNKKAQKALYQKIAAQYQSSNFWLRFVQFRFKALGGGRQKKTTARSEKK